MNTLLGIAVDATVNISDDCEVTYVVSPNCVEINFGHPAGSLFLGLTEAAAAKLVNVATAALAEVRALTSVADQDRP